MYGKGKTLNYLEKKESNIEWERSIKRNGENNNNNNNNSNNDKIDNM